MQMFNGLNMWLIKVYGLNFDPYSQESWDRTSDVIDYSSELKDINEKIRILSVEAGDENNNWAKQELNDKLSADFNNELLKTLDPQQKDELSRSIKEFLDSHNSDENFEDDYIGLLNLAKALNIPGYTDQVVASKEGDEQRVETENTVPELWLIWNLWQIKELWCDEQDNKEKTKWKFFSDIDKEQLDDNSWESQEQSSKLSKTMENIQQQIDKIKTLIDENNKNNLLEWHKLEDTKILLENFQKIIENPIPENVNELQKYIYQNLSGSEKWVFENENHKKKNGDFDSQFWKSTLMWLDGILLKTEQYISSFEQSWEQSESTDAFKDIKLKSEIDLSSWDWNVEASSLFDSLPGWITAEFKEGESINIEKKWEDQEVTVVLKWEWDESKEITLIVKISEDGNKLSIDKKSDGSQSENKWQQEALGSHDKTPLKINDDEYHQVLGNTNTLCETIWLEWATFYSVNIFVGVVPQTEWSWESVEPPKNWDYECLMKLGNNEVYKVKVDQHCNISPVVENFKSKKRLLLRNNQSCVRYLENKLPDLDPKPTIKWDRKMDDYVILSYDKKLSIEPMLIDGRRVSEKLPSSVSVVDIISIIVIKIAVWRATILPISPPIPEAVALYSPVIYAPETSIVPNISLVSFPISSIPKPFLPLR